MKMKIVLATICAIALGSSAVAAKRKAPINISDDDAPSSSYRRSANHTELMMDLTVNYLRGTQPDQETDTAPRMSVGGMFSDWIGLDFQGLYTARSKNFMVGADVRLHPVDWLYFKGGVGGYSDKATREFTVTPLFASGIRLRMTQQSYFVTEASYFQVNRREYMGIGAGLGVSF